MCDMTYAEAAVEILNSMGNDGPLTVNFVEAVEVALRALEEVEIQGQIIVNLNRDMKAMRKAMNGQSEYAYLGGDLISREALRERIELINWYSTNDKGVLHSGAADNESAFVRYADVYAAVEGALAVEAEPVVHAHWVPAPDVGDCCYRCSRCGKVIDHYCDEDDSYCSRCGAHMDEFLEIRTAYCPICDKHFQVRSNDSMGDCPDCGHHVVLHEVEVVDEN